MKILKGKGESLHVYVLGASVGLVLGTAVGLDVGDSLDRDTTAGFEEGLDV
jgi:hypothetical protein